MHFFYAPCFVAIKSVWIACFIAIIIIIIIIIIHYQNASRYTLPSPAASIHFLIVSFFQTQPLVAVSTPNIKVRPMCARYPCF